MWWQAREARARENGRKFANILRWKGDLNFSEHDKRFQLGTVLPGTYVKSLHEYFRSRIDTVVPTKLCSSNVKPRIEKERMTNMVSNRHFFDVHYSDAEMKWNVSGFIDFCFVWIANIEKIQWKKLQWFTMCAYRNSSLRSKKIPFLEIPNKANGVQLLNDWYRVCVCWGKLYTAYLCKFTSTNRFQCADNIYAYVLCTPCGRRMCSALYFYLLLSGGGGPIRIIFVHVLYPLLRVSLQRWKFMPNNIPHVINKMQNKPFV